ncbi:histidine phosphatase family protein, partial [Amylibacter sp.]|nr:histidine phosphatase family protein [Amylibacter sp.]
MTNWYWIRHGPTHLKSLVGWSDVDVDLSNINKLKKLDDYLPNDSLIISSDLKRTIKTATEIQNMRERLPNNKNLREFNFGEWELKKSSEIAAKYPKLSKDYWTSPGDIAPPNGESWNQAAKRINAEVDNINEKYKGK